MFVVTPTYCTEDNHRLPLLLQTVYWVRQQTYRDYLHIVVDDGSTDATPAVLERLSQSDPKLKFFRKDNGGSGAAINYGVEQALALGAPNYITICHSDDVLLPDSLDVRVQLAATTGAELVYTDEVVIYDTTAAPKQWRAGDHATPDDLFIALLQHRLAIPHVTMLWGADFYLRALQGYDARLTSSEDWDIALRSARALKTLDAKHATAHHVTVARRMHENCLRIQNIRDGTKQRCYAEILRKHVNTVSDEDFQIALDRAQEKLKRLHRPPLRPIVKERLERRPQLARLLRSFGLAPSRTTVAPCVAAFLKEMDEVDYGLMDFTTRSVTNTTRRPSK